MKLIPTLYFRKQPHNHLDCSIPAPTLKIQPCINWSAALTQVFAYASAPLVPTSANEQPFIQITISVCLSVCLSVCSWSKCMEEIYSALAIPYRLSERDMIQNRAPVLSPGGYCKHYIMPHVNPVGHADRITQETK